jgi:hypothetical protein
MRLLSRTTQLAAVVLCLVCALLFTSTTSAQQVTGAIYTTTSTGTTVNGNIYQSKGAVYLSGGPQNKNSAGLGDSTLVPGYWVFQVTDPSGSVLLSLDSITCRVVYVNLNSGGNGVVDGNPVGSPDSTAGGFGNTSCYHADGTQDDFNGALPVQLCNPVNNCLNNTDFANTPNPGGEYKAWLTPVKDYVGPTGTCTTGNNHFGFCDSLSKTDNFKIKNPNQADVIVCKFNDLNGNGIQDAGEPFLPDWPITATGVDANSPTTTGQDGCIDYTVSTFTNNSATVTLTEGSETGFTQTAPANGMYDANGNANCSSSCPTTVSGASGTPPSGGVITVVVSPGATVTAPFFGNTMVAALVSLQVGKTATGGNNFSWTINKSAGQLQMDTTNGTATFSYTVTVSHDPGTTWQVQGNISVTNPNNTGGTDGAGAIDMVSITDSIDNGGTCNVNGAGVGTPYSAGTIGGGATLNVPYTCTFATNPGSGNNLVSVSWDPNYLGGGPVSTTQPYDFTSADTSVTVTDTLAGNLGTVTINGSTSPITTACAAAASGFATNGSSLACSVASSTTTFTYSLTFTGDPAGTCTSHTNTASFQTNTGGSGSSSPVSVLQCVGEDVTVSKTASASFTAGIYKSVNKTTVQQSGGTITFNYTVSLTSPSFSVTGYITVSNPNNWESVTVNVYDTIDSGGKCTVTGGSGVTIPASGSSGPLSYTCAYTTNPTLVSGTNTATVSETGTLDTGTGDPNKGQAGIVPGTPTPGTAGYTFNTLTITDKVQSSTYPTGCTATLGTVSVTTTTASTSPGCAVLSLTSPSWGVFKYSITDNNAPILTCVSYNNTAQITGGSSSNQVTVTVCNTNNGALTMGFWKNPNGQKVITSFCAGTGGTSLTAFLSGFNPYKDDTATTCSKEAAYVANIISGANCSSGGTCNLMLRAQMLATALDVYFSTPNLGGNRIGAYNGLGVNTPQLGGVDFDLSHICSMADGSTGSTCTGVNEDARPEFGIAPPLLGTSVLQMLQYANFPSLVNGNPVASSPNGSTWYIQIKGRQVIAKDVFDNINNQIANIAPSGPFGAPSF